VAVWELATGKERRVIGTRPAKNEAAYADAMVFPEIDSALLGIANTSTLAFSPDGKILAQASAGGTLRLWDVITGQPLAEFGGHQGVISALAFAPDGRTLVSGSWDTTALVWPVEGANKKAGAPRKELDIATFGALCADLADSDAAKAWDAARALAGSPKQTVAYFQKRLQPAPRLDQAKVQALMAQLDSKSYKERQQAAAELLKLGERVVPALQEVLAAKPALETRKRVEDLLERLAALAWTSDQVATLRAVEVLEHTGTAEALQLLERLAEGAPGALITTSAQVAVQRLQKRAEKR
jgi:WD domain, G-beta repeat